MSAGSARRQDLLGDLVVRTEAEPEGAVLGRRVDEDWEGLAPIRRDELDEGGGVATELTLSLVEVGQGSGGCHFVGNAPDIRLKHTRMT